MKKNILIVTSIFSGKSNSGSDKYTLEISNLLSLYHDITICTTTSQNYVKWDSPLLEGTEYFNRIKIVRFKPIKERNIFKFNRFMRKISKNNNLKSSEYDRFIYEQGPIVPNLIEYLKSNHKNFDIILFIGYLYYPIVYGIPICKETAIVVPTLHDESVAYFPIYNHLLSQDLIYSFNTLEELEVYKKIFNRTPDKYSIIGTCTTLNPNFLSEKKCTHQNYILYVGRVEEGKGVGALIEYFKIWKRIHPSDLKLLIVGGGGDPKNSSKDIIYIGYASEEEKYSFLKNATLLINPSPMESFSIVLMEAWLFQKPVLVNSNSDTMKNHCIRSNGGLYFQDLDSFMGTLNYLLKHPEIRKKMGENGKKYVEANYSPDIVLAKYEQIFSYILPKESK